MIRQEGHDYDRLFLPTYNIGIVARSSRECSRESLARFRSLPSDRSCFTFCSPSDRNVNSEYGNGERTIRESRGYLQLEIALP
jgi:hypothetical protein